jgi:hypothetical protein
MKTNIIQNATDISVLLCIFLAVTLAGCDFLKDEFLKEDKIVEEAYLEYHKAFLSGDLEALKKYVTKERKKKLEIEGTEDKMRLVRELYPPRVSIKETAVKGNKAYIIAEASSKRGFMKGNIRLLKENGTWKVMDEKWELSIDKSD